MTPDDPRHGTNGGYLAGCHDACCRPAHAAYRRSVWRKRYTRGVDRLYVDSTGTRRRIRALMARGWRYADIEAALGRAGRDTGGTWAHNLGRTTGDRRGRVHIDNARAVAAVYAALSATDGPSERTRSLAARRGWLGPEWWDDDTIDDPDADPTTAAAVTYDPVVVERILGGDWRLPATADERREVLRRWLANGRSGNELGRLTGWGKVERYRQVAA